MELIQEFLILLQFAQVPAEIQIVAAHVRQTHEWVVNVQHKGVSHCGQAGGVQLVAQVVEDAVVLHHVVVDTARRRDFVGKPPADDGGVVVVLQNQFRHLLYGVLAGFGHVLGDVGNLCPRHKAVFVAQVVEIGIVLVVRQTHAVASHFQQQGHIFLMLFAGQRTAKTLTVLMTRPAAQAVAASIEDKALFGVNRKAAAAECCFHHVAAFRQFGPHCVEIRVVHAVPQVGIFQRKAGGSIAVVIDRHSLFLCAQCECDGLRRVADPCFRADVRAGEILIQRRRDLQSGAAVAVQSKVCGRNGEQVHIAVQPAVKGEIGFLWVDRAVLLVADADGQQVLAAVQDGQSHAERGIADRMAAQLLTVQIDLGRHSRAAKFQPVFRAVRRLRQVERFIIPRFASIVVVAAVLTVLCIPSVGQRDGLRLCGADHRIG